MMIALSYQLLKIYTNPFPTAPYQKLICTREDIVLVDKREEEHYFQKRKLVFNTGLFYFFMLTAPQTRKYLLVFSDQISRSELRLIKLGPKLASK